MKILEKSEKTPFFCIKLMQNHVERCFRSSFFQWMLSAHVVCVSGMHLMTA